MKKAVILSSVLSIILIVSCGAPKEGSTTDSVIETVTPASCTFSYEQAPVEVLWVAYKYTEKTGVKGVFEQSEVNATASGNTPAEALQGATISISTGSSNTGDPTRDPKIKDAFFGALTEGETISGVITSATGDIESGSVEANLTMNGVSKTVPGAYSVKDDQVELKFELNVGDWSAMDALNALNEVCEDLHKGADGKSILWPDVTVFVTTSLAKNCQ